MLAARVLALAALLVAPALVACGSDTSGRSGAAAPSGSAAEEQGTFPAVVEHRHGSTTIEQQPTRVVSVGLTELPTTFPST